MRVSVYTIPYAMPINILYFPGFSQNTRANPPPSIPSTGLHQEIIPSEVSQELASSPKNLFVMIFEAKELMLRKTNDKMGYFLCLNFSCISSAIPIW